MSFINTDSMNKINKKEPKDVLIKYEQEREKEIKYCYKPYRTLHNY